MNRIPLALIFVLLPATAFAHPSLAAHAHGLAAGVSHPFTGMDHLLAMLSVGLWASQQGGRAFWLWPASFVAAMIAGGVLGMMGTALPLIEPAIAASLLVLGLMVAGAVNLSSREASAWGAGLIALFGLFHGNAHGLEAGGDGAAYAIGFTLATVTLHALGVALGRGAWRARARPALRCAAALIAVTGAALLFVS
jgi:urease accessory protein